MSKNLEYLQGRVEHHADRMNYYFEKVTKLEAYERLIGFKTKNDNRQSTDGIVLVSSKITTESRF